MVVEAALAEKGCCRTMSQLGFAPMCRAIARPQCCRTRQRSSYQTMWEDHSRELAVAAVGQCKPMHAAHPWLPLTRSFST